MRFPIEDLSTANFPPLLHEITQKPKRLFVRGELPDPERYLYICGVGSRAVSAYGKRAIASILAGLAGQPIAIVSGLALGADAEVHKAALEAGLPTVAVLPSGLGDTTIYPALNRPLAARILTQGGALLSEYEADFRPALWSFPARNRIMAGLCRAVIIFEAPEKSGTLITARLALDYNREVMCVPHPIGVESGAGANRLIREGAALIRGADDVLDALGLARQAEVRDAPQDLTAFERAIFSALTEPLTRDEVAQRSGVGARDAAIALSSLSLRGLLVERMGKIERA